MLQKKQKMIIMLAVLFSKKTVKIVLIFENYAENCASTVYQYVVTEHMGISPLGGKKHTNPSTTRILSHHVSTRHFITFEDFSIISSALFESELLL